MDIDTLWYNNVEFGDSSGILILNIDFPKLFKPTEDNGLDTQKLSSIDLGIFNDAFLRIYTLLFIKSSIHDFRTLVDTIVSYINDEYSSTITITMDDFNINYLDELYFFTNNLFRRYDKVIDPTIMDLLDIHKHNDSYRVLYRVRIK